MLSMQQAWGSKPNTTKGILKINKNKLTKTPELSQRKKAIKILAIVRIIVFPLDFYVSKY